MTERARLMYDYHTRARIAANPIPVCTGMPFFFGGNEMHHILSAAVLLIAGIFLVAKGGDRFVDSAKLDCQSRRNPCFHYRRYHCQHRHHVAGNNRFSYGCYARIH